jgi:hypothetical protein
MNIDFKSISVDYTRKISCWIGLFENAFLAQEHIIDL